MASTAEPTYLTIPRANANDDSLRVLEWKVPDGQAVQGEQVIVVLEGSKAVFDFEAPSEGYLFHLAAERAMVPVGAPFGVLCPTPQRPTELPPAELAAEGDGPNVTKKAAQLIEHHGLSLERFAHLSVVKSRHVEAYLRSQQQPDDKPADAPPGSLPEDGILDTDDYRSFMTVIDGLERRMQARYERHVPTGSLLIDRAELAKRLGAGEGSTIYPDSLVMGNVTIGKQCWIGPFTVLDGGNAPLTIGDYTSVGSGAQLYTHSTFELALTGYKAEMMAAETRIGNCCFIAPLAMIGPGSQIGDHCYIAPYTHVDGTFEPKSIIAGNPGRVVGRVEIVRDRARLHYFHADEASS
jgi:acetyltransferase-like isoleucine patch superfamily enzyme